MEKITLNHGAGGCQMQEFIKSAIVKKLSNGILERLDDCAVLPTEKTSRMAMTSDSFVVSPLFFEGGDIGRLCIAGTANDLATSGANVHAMSLSFIIEEGMDLETIERITDSIAQTAKEAQVRIVTGDTKVVEKGKGDGIFINTCAMGFIPEGYNLSTYNAQVGDVVILTGSMGDHEVALMKARGLIDFELDVKSDVAPLNLKVKELLSACSPSDIRIIKDPTRGGVASALHEIAEHSCCTIRLDEVSLPIDSQVKAVCELTGIDPLYMANEGKYIIVGNQNILPRVRDIFSPRAIIVGEVIDSQSRGVLIRTQSRAERRIAALENIQLPRIC